MSASALSDERLKRFLPAATEPIDSGKLASTSPARHGPEQGTFEVIPCDRIQGGRDQFIGFRRATPVFGLEPLGFLNIVDRELAQPADLGIFGNWINRRQQIPGAVTGAFTSQASHQRLLALCGFL